MTIKKTISEIRKLLDALSEKKTDKDKDYLLFKIKLVVEIAREPITERMDKEKMAYKKQTRIITKALKQFLNALDKIFSKHEELGDTDVREQMYRAIYRGFIQPQPAYSLPERFGMFSDKGNDLVRAALHGFLTHPEVVAASRLLKTPEDRFAAFQDSDAKTTEGTHYSEYFGYSKQVRVA